jgi:hypothetical protein
MQIDLQGDHPADLCETTPSETLGVSLGMGKRELI